MWVKFNSQYPIERTTSSGDFREKYLPCGSVIKNSSASAEAAGDAGSIPGSGRSLGEGNGNPLLVFLPGKSHGRGKKKSNGL